ncbi:MAG: ABC transporter ATP-binding protein [Desulfobacteraceae bacterium]|jgi:lipoprotein-releasing system ATP-binding protein|nr:ABC transporter ATP-binding protein [Desulfobacteraceae bacterium]
MLNEDQRKDSEQLESMIAVRDLHKSFSNGGISIDVLKELNFDLFSGETVAIVGASGIGKSTLLHIVGTLDRPDGGKLLFKGEDVFLYDDFKLARFRNESVGFVFQFHHLLPEFSALENVMMPALIQGIGKSPAAQAAEEVLVRVGLQDRLNYRVGKLSGGEQQRVALARALVLKPLVLLADEPTGNLDRANSERIHALLMELNREFSMTLVVVTHNSDLAACMSRRVTIVEGKLTAMP